MRLSQIALSVSDVRRSQRWYRDVLGLEPGGGTNLFAGPLSSMVQGVPRAASTCWWLVDRQDLFQVELFEFRSPSSASCRPTGARATSATPPSASGSTTWTPRWAGLGRREASPLTEPIGEPGARRVCLRDPDGVLVELMEEDPRSDEPRERPREEIGAVARAVTLSVSDLAGSRRFFEEVLGLPVVEGLELHRPEHEALWGLDGAKSERMCLWADDFLVELVSYSDPSGRGWPEGYRISDLGLLNIAFGFRTRSEFDEACRRCAEAGVEGNGPPLHLGAWSVIYVNDDQGFSVELLHVEPWYERQMGFRPRPTPRFAPFAGGTPARRLRPGSRFGKAIITGAAGGIGAELARLAAEDGTSLVLMDREGTGLSELAAELGDQAEVATAEVDFTDLEAVDATIASLVDAHPDVDLLLAGAGLDRAQSLLAFDWRQAEDDFKVNALSNLVLLSHLVPAMAERGRGHVTAIVEPGGPRRPAL